MTARRTFLVTFAGGILAAPLAAEAQPAAKVARIGLSVDLVAAPPHLHEAFRQGLRDLGYVEGRNVVIEYRDAGGKVEQLSALSYVGPATMATHCLAVASGFASVTFGVVARIWAKRG